VDIRTGLGWDNHRIAVGRPLILGGIRVESEFGLEGHSDADVLSHAITDAILGAAALGDIGMHFPDSDREMERRRQPAVPSARMQLGTRRGLLVSNVDSTVILEGRS
jgi:2-C-methyl-D-erythritol 2,4-cyclodiphosphate synthase